MKSPKRQGGHLCTREEEPKCCGLGPHQLATPILQGWAEATDEPAAAILKLRIVGNSQSTGAFLTASAKVGPTFAGSVEAPVGDRLHDPPILCSESPWRHNCPHLPESRRHQNHSKEQTEVARSYRRPCRSSTTAPSLPSLLYFLQSIYQHLTHLFYLCC